MLSEYKPETINRNGEYTREDGEIDWMEVGIWAYTFYFGWSTPYIIMFIIFERFDCIQFILDDIFPQVEHRELSTILMHGIIRVIFVAPSLAEVIRSLNAFLLIGLTALKSCFNMWNCLLKNIISPHDFVFNYRLYELAYGYFEFALANVLLVVLTITFWGTVVAIWFCIKCSGLVDHLVYACLAGGTVLAVVVSAMIMPQITVGNHLGQEALKKQSIVANLTHAKVKTRKSLVAKKQTLSLRILMVRYGPFFLIGDQYALEYFSTLNQRVVDSVLMFQLG